MPGPPNSENIRGTDEKTISDSNRGLDGQARSLRKRFSGLPEVVTNMEANKEEKTDRYSQNEIRDSKKYFGSANVDLEIGIIVLEGFTVGKSDLKPAHIELLESFIANESSLTQPESGGAVIENIVGYTDSVGPGELNDKLRMARASAVAQFLVNNLNVLHQQIKHASGAPTGEYPTQNETEEQRRLNRSVIIYFQPSKSIISTKLEALTELNSILKQRVSRNNLRIERQKEWAEEPKLPGRQEQDKSFFQRVLELFAEVAKEGRDIDPSGLGEALEYEYDLEYWEKNLPFYEDEIAYLMYENELIATTQSEINMMILRLRKGRQSQISDLEVKVKKLLSLGYRK